jgi:hypothetical protein
MLGMADKTREYPGESPDIVLNYVRRTNRAGDCLAVTSLISGALSLAGIACVLAIGTRVAASLAWIAIASVPPLVALGFICGVLAAKSRGHFVITTIGIVLSIIGGMIFIFLALVLMATRHPIMVG